jgi:hypothetical protein
LSPLRRHDSFSLSDLDLDLEDIEQQVTGMALSGGADDSLACLMEASFLSALRDDASYSDDGDLEGMIGSGTGDLATAPADDRPPDPRFERGGP